jgi:glycosyltransferase involved in cell wall biosynthesis
MGFRALSIKRHFDLVHVHAHPVRLTNLGNTPLVMSEGSSSAVYLQDYLNWDNQRLALGYSRARWVYKWLRIHDRLLNVRNVSRVYVFSEWARNINVRWGADPARLEVIYPGFPTPPPVDRSARGQFTFGFIGTDFERKGGFEVVEAFDTLATRYSGLRLLLVGSDPTGHNADRAIHSWVARERRDRVLGRLRAMEKCGLVERHPMLDRASLYEMIYPRTDVFVMPSRAEGFGFTNVEALSFGLPVISSRVGAIPEVIEDGVTGLLVPPGDVDSLVSAMDRLATDRLLRLRMGIAARSAFLARFTLDRFRARLGCIYQTAIRNSCARF